MLAYLLWALRLFDNPVSVLVLILENVYSHGIVTIPQGLTDLLQSPTVAHSQLPHTCLQNPVLWRGHDTVFSKLGKGDVKAPQTSDTEEPLVAESLMAEALLCFCVWEAAESDRAGPGHVCGAGAMFML